MSDAASDAKSGPERGADNPRLTLIAAVARNGCIGRDNALVWRHPDDAKWFRQQTLGCPVVMGRRTWESLPAKFRPLPGRDNIVVTRQLARQADGALVAHDLDQALALARASAIASGAQRIFVIGGSQLYAQALPLADELVLTEIDADLAGDAWFPAWRREDFVETRRERHGALAASADSAGAGFDFAVYERRR